MRLEHVQPVQVSRSLLQKRCGVVCVIKSLKIYDEKRAEAGENFLSYPRNDLACLSETKILTGRDLN